MWSTLNGMHNLYTLTSLLSSSTIRCLWPTPTRRSPYSTSCWRTRPNSSSFSASSRTTERRMNSSMMKRLTWSNRSGTSRGLPLRRPEEGCRCGGRSHLDHVWTPSRRCLLNGPISSCCSGFWTKIEETNEKPTYPYQLIRKLPAPLLLSEHLMIFFLFSVFFLQKK